MIIRFTDQQVEDLMQAQLPTDARTAAHYWPEFERRVAVLHGKDALETISLIPGAAPSAYFAWARERAEKNRQQ